MALPGQDMSPPSIRRQASGPKVTGRLWSSGDRPVRSVRRCRHSRNVPAPWPAAACLSRKQSPMAGPKTAEAAAPRHCCRKASGGLTATRRFSRGTTGRSSCHASINAISWHAALVDRSGISVAIESYSPRVASQHSSQSRGTPRQSELPRLNWNSPLARRALRPKHHRLSYQLPKTVDTGCRVCRTIPVLHVVARVLLCLVHHSPAGLVLGV